MLLADVLAGVALAEPIPASALLLPVTGLEYDSRRVEPGFLFFAFPGAKTDGRQFAEAALKNGAVAVVSESHAPESFPGTWIRAVHGRRAMSSACRQFFGRPSLSLVGLTGTNGKTTSTYLCDAVLRRAGFVTGVLGTIGNVIAGEHVPAVNTTPESVDLYKLFATLTSRGGTHAVMEVSSHALELGRVYALDFHAAVFTNLTQDHLDFHPSMQDYFAAKQRLFNANGGAPPAWAVLNHDDVYGRQIQTSPDTRVLTYGLDGGAMVRATDVELGFDGLSFLLTYGDRHLRVRSPMVGHVNVYNILAAFCTGITYGLDEEMIAEGIAGCPSVAGRFQRIDEGQPFMVIVDYAHTDDALRNAIRVARSLRPKRVITLFGCGGDRDRKKRPLMGAAAAELSDFVVLTSDNPRSEDPLDIINDALVGLRRYDTPHIVEADRAKAIRAAVAEAKAGDLILLAGKGHETYQVQKETTIHFDDREQALRALQELGFGK